MFGKIIDNKLVIAGSTIKTSKGVIYNPTNEQLILNGWKEVVYSQKPTYDIEEYKLVEVYTETNNIVVSYNQVALADEEHNNIIQQEILEEENKLTARNYRMAIKGDTYALGRIDTIESAIATLRAKLR